MTGKSGFDFLQRQRLFY